MNALNIFAVLILTTVSFVSATPAPEPHKFRGYGVAYPIASYPVPVAVPVPVVPIIQPIPVVAAPIYGGVYG